MNKNLFHLTIVSKIHCFYNSFSVTIAPKHYFVQLSHLSSSWSLLAILPLLKSKQNLLRGQFRSRDKRSSGSAFKSEQFPETETKPKPVSNYRVGLYFPLLLLVNWRWLRTRARLRDCVVLSVKVWFVARSSAQIGCIRTFVCGWPATRRRRFRSLSYRTE